MRTLKKTLALVLVVAMMMSLCITSNAAFTDADEIEYTEAVEVLTTIGVIDGFPSGEFQPQGSLTRAQAAKILVYLLGAEKVALADGQIFDDVAPNHWAADYIAYCAENGLVNGYGNGKFGPEDKLTGYQWAKMLLAAMGVDTTEMIGQAWQIPVATAAAKYGVFAGNVAADKTAICTREEACLYALNALLDGYASYGYPLYKDGKAVAWYATVTEAAHAAEAMNELDNGTYTIGYKKVPYNAGSMLEDIHGVYNYVDYDNWQIPYNVYTDVFTFELAYEIPAIVEYTTATTECDVAADLGLYVDADVEKHYDNGDSVLVTGEEINTLGTKAPVGGQGTLTLVYDIDGDHEYEIVEIDQYLAVVADVTEAEYDRKGHLAEPAWLTLAVYAENGMELVYKPAYAWDFEIGDMLLVYFDEADAADDDNYAEIVAYADSIVGAQTAFTTKASHIVEKTEYMDAVQFNHDEAGVDVADYTWYFDTYGNLIGSFEIQTIYSYGVVSAIKWVENDSLLENGYALATITYMDGTSENLKVYSIAGKELCNFADNAGYVDVTKQYNAGWVRDALYQIESTKLGYVLTETNILANAKVTTGVPAIGTSMNAGDATMFLVYNNVSRAYETYTGIENVPSYKSIGEAWYVDLNGDKAAEYVFLNSPVGVDSDVKTAYYWTEDLTVTSVLSPVGGISYYVISGGEVNGEPAEIMTASQTIVTEILANDGILMVLDSTNDLVVDVTVVTDDARLLYINGAPVWVVYAGEVADASVGQNVLMTSAASYNIRTAEVDSYNGKTLAWHLKNNDGYMYVFYTQNAAGVKNALTVYVSDEENVLNAQQNAVDALVAYIEEATGSDDATKDTTDMTATGWGANYETLAEIVATWTSELYAQETVAAVEAKLAAQIAVFESADAATKYVDACMAADGYVKVNVTCNIEGFTASPIYVKSDATSYVLYLTPVADDAELPASVNIHIIKGQLNISASCVVAADGQVGGTLGFIPDSIVIG